MGALAHPLSAEAFSFVCECCDTGRERLPGDGSPCPANRNRPDDRNEQVVTNPSADSARAYSVPSFPVLIPLAQIGRTPAASGLLLGVGM